MNPYYVYVELSIGNYSINNIDNGAISLQASYKTDSFCTFIIEVYDDTAHKLADAILTNGREITVSYGYAESDLMVEGRQCVITNIHTELIGTGEVLTLELIPSSLDKVLLSISENHTSDKKYTGSPSKVLKEVIKDIGWTEGNIVDCKDLRGENNGNDNLDDPEDYYYWRSNQPVTDFMNSLIDYAITEDGIGDFILYTDYNTDPPTVNFFPSQNAPEGVHIQWVYGREESEIISLNVDWGDALLTHVGYLGSTLEVQDDTTNEIYSTEHGTGYAPEDTKPAEAQIDGYNGESLTSRKGIKVGPQGEETYYSTLKLGSKPFTWTIMQNPGKGMENWKQYYRSDGVMMWGDYVVVAADISGNYGEEYDPNTGKTYPALPDHKGKFERGDIVETSLGKGIVVDACRAACDVSYGKFDISVNWGK